jgi:hypothetical protein
MLAMRDVFMSADKADLYLWSSILDLAASLTLLIDRPDRKDFYPMVEDLYRKLLDKDAPADINLDTILSEDLAASRSLSTRLAIPPLERYDTKTRRELYERMKENIFSMA